MKTAQDVSQWAGDRGVMLEPGAYVWHWKAGKLWLVVTDQPYSDHEEVTQDDLALLVCTHREDGSSITVYEVYDEVPIDKAPAAFRNKFEECKAQKKATQMARLTQVFKRARSSKGAGLGYQEVELAASLSVGLSATEVRRCIDVAAEDADVNEIYGELELITAILNGDVEAIEMADDTLAYDINTNFSALHLAIFTGRSKMVSALVDAGANVNPYEAFRASALHYATHTDGDNPVAVVEKLIEAGAKVDALDQDGLTPLHIAAGRGNVEIMKVLINAGADVNAVDYDEDAPLYAAVRCNELEAVDILINAGAQVNIRDSENLTILEFAKRRGYAEIYKILKRASAPDGV